MEKGRAEDRGQRAEGRGQRAKIVIASRKEPNVVSSVYHINSLDYTQFTCDM